MLLIMLQQTVRVSVYTFSDWNIRHIYFIAMAVLTACLLPSVVYSVRDRKHTMQLIMESMGMNLCIAMCMNHLLLTDSIADAVVFLQVLLVHLFYNLSRAAHENQHKKILSYRQAVRSVGLLSAVTFPCILAVRCPSREVDMKIVLVVMFAGEMIGFAVMLLCSVVRTFGNLYERMWQF